MFLNYQSGNRRTTRKSKPLEFSYQPQLTTIKKKSELHNTANIKYWHLLLWLIKLFKCGLELNNNNNIKTRLFEHRPKNTHR